MVATEDRTIHCYGDVPRARWTPAKASSSKVTRPMLSIVWLNCENQWLMASMSSGVG